MSSTFELDRILLQQRKNQNKHFAQRGGIDIIVAKNDKMFLITMLISIVLT